MFNIEDEAMLAQSEVVLYQLLEAAHREAQWETNRDLSRYIWRAMAASGNNESRNPMMPCLNAAYRLSQAMGYDDVTGFIGQALAEIDRPGSGAGEE